MNSILTKAFLGNTSNQYQFDGFTISVVEYTQQVSEEWHFHETPHISSILQGGNLESRKTNEFQVNPGRIMMYEQGEVHRNRFTAHPSKNLNIEFNETFFSNEILFAHLNPDENISTEFFKIYFELLFNDIYSLKAIEQIVTSLFWEDRYNKEGNWIAKLKELLNDRWDEFPSLNELSDELNMHPITISKYFARNTGMTLSEYLRKLKVKRAVDFLLNTTKSYAEIAFLCGFSDQSHLTRLVRKYTGYTPGTIRSLA